jgi:O-antigen/teichoic acid export membrane protein
MFLFVLLTLFIEDLIRVRIGSVHFIHPDYWSGALIIPVILLAYAFNGAYVNFLIGVYLEKKTSVLPAVFGIGAVVNIVANFLLIPAYGIMGAAYATLLSYAALAIGIYVPSQKLYRIDYEWKKIVGLLAVVTLVVSVSRLFPVEPATIEGLAWKFALAASFVILLFFGRIITWAELREAGKTMGNLTAR